MYRAVTIPELNTTRRVWVYLPEDYAFSGKNYPVLYMQDGQNLFDVKTSFSGEWEVDEYLDSIDFAGIVIGIDNGGENRVIEYNPNDDPRHGKGLGREYLVRIVKDLKPYIDSHFRTLPGRENTAIAGSSMGGLIAFYAGIYYPDIFGSVGVISPSFWIARDIEKQIMIQRSEFFEDQRWYFYGGGLEGEDMVERVENIGKLLSAKLKCEVCIALCEKGTHSESSWRKMFPAFYNWLMNADTVKR